ncbi:hypothetical protein PVAND_012631 [Polypedilum vanderplanki]|uniref:Odorant receptor n=1 Tax=Polypedilum vanderplanki TaxID=319348 RepID=A0A9J6CM79_POLVA|nr:hypothetical protein PVAND_012631 [Polypedilum vanderplanki]
MKLEIFKYPIFYLKFVGLWIQNDSSLFYKIYACIMQIFFHYIWIILMGASIPEKNNLIELAELLTFFFTYVASIAKFTNINLKINEFLSLIFDIKNAIKNFEVPEIYIKKQFSFGKKLLIGYWLPAFIGVLFSGILPFFTGEFNISMWFPYDTNRESLPILFYLSTVYQLIEVFMHSNANVMIDTMCILPMIYLLAMLEHLCNKLENLKRYKLINFDGKVKKIEELDNQKELLNCVNYQRTIVELTRRTEAIFAKVIAIQGSLLSIILCTIAFALTTLTLPDDLSAMFKFSNFMIAMIFQLAIPCYYGAMISLQFDKISYSAFYSDWFYEDQKYRKDFYFFMQNATREFKLSAFGLYKINFLTFKKVVNMAYSFYAVFKRIH